VRAAESNTINEKRTKTLAKSIIKKSFIKPFPENAKGWVLAMTLSLRKVVSASDMPD
jgi:hypothetical protein